MQSVWVQETNIGILRNGSVPDEGLFEPSNRNVQKGEKIFAAISVGQTSTAKALKEE